MVPHRVRLYIIALIFALALIGAIVLSALGKADTEGFIICATLVAVLTPALVDAEQVRRKRFGKPDSDPDESN